MNDSEDLNGRIVRPAFICGRFNFQRMTPIRSDLNMFQNNQGRIPTKDLRQSSEKARKQLGSSLSPWVRANGIYSDIFP